MRSGSFSTMGTAFPRDPPQNDPWIERCTTQYLRELQRNLLVGLLKAKHYQIFPVSSIERT